MKLIINGKEETIAFPGETLGDFLIHVEQVGVKQGNVIRSVKLDGQVFSPDPSVARQKPLLEIGTLEVEISTLQGLLIKI